MPRLRKTIQQIRRIRIRSRHGLQLPIFERRGLPRSPDQPSHRCLHVPVPDGPIQPRPKDLPRLALQEPRRCYLHESLYPRYQLEGLHFWRKPNGRPHVDPVREQPDRRPDRPRQRCHRLQGLPALPQVLREHGQELLLAVLQLAFEPAARHVHHALVLGLQPWIRPLHVLHGRHDRWFPC